MRLKDSVVTDHFIVKIKQVKWSDMLRYEFLFFVYCYRGRWGASGSSLAHLGVAPPMSVDKYC